MLAFYKNFEIKSSYKGNKSHQNDYTNFHNHMITVTDINTSKKFTFEYWSTDGHEEIKEKVQLVEAFLLLLKEASVGSLSFDEYLTKNNLHQDNLTDVLKKKHISYYKRCQKMNGKLTGVYAGDISSLINETENYLQYFFES